MSTILVWATDPHLADHPPVSRVDEWSDSVLDKFSQVGDICRKEKASASLWGGDIFHVKSPDQNTHRLVNRLSTTLLRYPCERWSCFGNHDCRRGDSKALPDAPLETLFINKAFKRCYDKHEATVWTGKPKDPTVRVVGVPYHGTSYDMDKFKAFKKGDEDYLVCLVHCLASPTGGTMFEREDVIKYSDLLTLNPDVDVWCFGHWHHNQGVVEIADGKWVVNIGSLVRGALTEDNLDRIPECAVLRFSDKIKIDRVPLKVKPASKVFDLEKRVQVEARDVTMSSFVDKLQRIIRDKSDADFGDQIQNLDDVSDIIKERASEYIEVAKGMVKAG